MKKSILLLIGSFMLSTSNAQEKKLDSISFLKFVNNEYVDIKVFSKQFGEIKLEMIIPFYEFEVSKIGTGDACLFAVSKKYPESWIEKAKKGECATRSNYYGSLRCQAKQLFKKDTLLLKQELDIFVFLIDKKELESPFNEEVEGGVYENYTPKKGCSVNIYKLNMELNEWKIIDTQINVTGEIPRLFGETYIEKIAIKKINDFLNHKD